tara:strand:- start:1658 stop:1966 length:309 start_codon:yes stop_codon:yes gene_type:complete
LNNNLLPEYRYTEVPDNDNGAIRISNGKFRGFTYQYGVVSLDPKEESCKLNFTYSVVDNEHGYPINEELVNIMGGILTELINERYDDGSDYRNNYSDKSNSE